MKVALVLFFVIMFTSIIPIQGNFADTTTQPAANTNKDKPVEQVICNVIKFVQNLGLPIMTGVILGSSIMAIFGRLPWPAIVMLVVFTAIFFGAGKLITKFANGVNSTTESTPVCDNIK